MAKTLITKPQIENLQIVDSDIASGANIATSKLADGTNFIKRDGSIAYTGDQSLGGNKLTNLGAPTLANDAVRLVDLQNNQAGLSGKDAVRAATTANITLSGTQTIDGVSLVAGDRVLVKNQTTATQNGIYNVATGAWTRSTDADANAELKSGTYVFVTEGTTNGDSGWMLSTDGTITVGTTNLLFVQFTGGAQLNAGTGMTKTGNTLDVVGTAGRIVANADSIDLATAGTAGTYTKVTTDAYGRVTSGTTATPADIGAQPSNANLTNLAGLSALGFYVSLGANTNIIRTLASGAGISITNADGQSGNPSIALSTTGTAGTYNSVTTDAYGRVTAGTNQTYMNSSNYVVRATPTGAVNGANTSFVLPNTPLAGKEMVFLNGQLLEPGAGNDYTISGNTITMLTAPSTGSIIRATYYY